MQKLVFDKRTHSYYVDNKRLISVSKIINTYLGSSYNNVPKDILKNAAIRGQWVHKANELYLKNINKENVINNILEKIKPLTNNNNYSLCTKSLNFIKNNLTKEKNKFEIEKPIYFQEIAGTPDLIVKNKNKNYIVDYKTYSIFTKKLREKTELQLTAYYWILLNNGIKVDNTAYIYWINKNIETKIIITITIQHLEKWKQAIANYKEWEGN